HLKSLLIPVSPFNEQNRLVARVYELLSLCDQLEQQSLTSLDAHQQLVETLLATLTDSQNAEELAENWARISQHFDTLFTTEASIDALKQTILQLAVMGKLVPQDPNDEPASELLKRIEQEKAQLVKEGKIKKQKPFPSI
ncbi:restriction endonuclease subunit S, partial [Escherichia coli]